MDMISLSHMALDNKKIFFKPSSIFVTLNHWFSSLKQSPKMENANSGRRKWDQYSEYGVSSSHLSPRLIPGSLSCPGDPGGPKPHFIFLISCSLWRLKWDSAQESENLEAVPGDPGRCVLAQTHCLDWRGLIPL